MVGLNPKCTNIIEVEKVFQFSKISQYNVGGNVKAHCALITSVIISCTQRFLWENESPECDSLSDSFLKNQCKEKTCAVEIIQLH